MRQFSSPRILRLMGHLGEHLTNVERNHKLDAPLGVRGINSDNRLIENELNWKPEWSLTQGLQETYSWISDQVRVAV